MIDVYVNVNHTVPCVFVEQEFFTQCDNFSWGQRSPTVKTGVSPRPQITQTECLRLTAAPVLDPEGYFPEQLEVAPFQKVMRFVECRPSHSLLHPATRGMSPHPGRQ
jgi:hypothetical protein